MGRARGDASLEIEDFYASPKATSRGYRVVPMIIRTDVLRRMTEEAVVLEHLESRGRR